MWIGGLRGMQTGELGARSEGRDAPSLGPVQAGPSDSHPIGFKLADPLGAVQGGLRCCLECAAKGPPFAGAAWISL